MDKPPASNYRRGRSGRPFNRAKDRLRREGDHVCWICGQQIDMTLRQGDGAGWDWTLDHVLPLSLDDQDMALDPSNHREAHRRCNSSRGNRVVQPPITGSRRW